MFTVAREIKRDIVRQINVLKFRFSPQDSYLCFDIWGLDIGDQSPFETRVETLFDFRDLTRRTIRREHDLLLRVIERIERVKELFLRPLLAGDELDVID